MLEKIAHIIGVSRQEIRRQMKNNKNAFTLQGETAPFRVTREQMEKVNELHVLGIVAPEVRLKQTGEINHLIGDVGRTKGVSKAIWRIEKDLKTNADRYFRITAII